MGSPTQYWQLPYKSRKYEWFSLPNYVAYTFSSVFLRTIDIYQGIYFFFFQIPLPSEGILFDPRIRTCDEQ